MHKHNRQDRFNGNRQQGVALVISLLVLLVMTVIGLAAIRTTTLEEKMAGNMQDKMLSFQAAEAALRAGENALSETNMDDDEKETCVTGGVYDSGTLGNIDCFVLGDNINPVQASAAGIVATDPADPADQIAAVSQQPRFVAEYVEKRPWGAENPVIGGKGKKIGAYYFRVTGHGFGGSPNASTVLRSYYGRRYQHK